VPRSRELNLAWELAQALDYPYFALGHNVTLKKGRYGNATLSRFPILRETNIDLTIASSTIGSLIRRGCQHTTLALPGGTTLEAFNLHLGLSAREREKQVGLLVNSAEFRRVPPEVPLLVGGDFNDWRSLLRPIFTEVFGFRCATDRKGGWALKTYPSFSPQGGLDRILLPRAVRADEHPLLPACRSRGWRATTCRSSPNSSSPRTGRAAPGSPWPGRSSSRPARCRSGRCRRGSRCGSRRGRARTGR